MFALLALLIGGDVARLGDDDYGTRQAAELRLRLAGPLALGYLADAEGQSDNPEIRHRANLLLRPWRSRLLTIQGAAWLLSDEPVTAADLHRRPAAMVRAARIAEACNLTPWFVDCLDGREWCDETSLTYSAYWARVAARACLDNGVVPAGEIPPVGP